MSMDMHCHLDLYSNPFKVAAECKQRGIYVLSMTTTPKAWDGTSRLAEGSPRIRTALGLHPQVAHQRYSELELFDSLLPKTRYVGEIGLDGGAVFKTHWELQLKVLRHILHTVHHSGDKIISIHSRASVPAVLDELRGIDAVPILHWFTGTKSQLKKAIDQGCWFSVGPAMLSTKKGVEAVSIIPKDRILIETDGPFAKYKRKELMPWDCSIAEEMLSSILGLSIEQTSSDLRDNLKSLLSL